MSSFGAHSDKDQLQARLFGELSIDELGDSSESIIAGGPRNRVSDHSPLALRLIDVVDDRFLYRRKDGRTAA